MADCLRETLPADYATALGILREVAPSVRGFEAISLPEFVGRYGLDHWDLSLPALRFLTQFGSSEMAHASDAHHRDTYAIVARRGLDA